MFVCIELINVMNVTLKNELSLRDAICRMAQKDKLNSSHVQSTSE